MTRHDSVELRGGWELRAGLVSAAGIALLAGACATSPAGPGPQAGPGSVADGQAATPADTVAAHDSAWEGEMTLEHARNIVAEVEREWPPSPDDPLIDPQSLDDVEQILKRDQVNLFPQGIELVAQMETRDARALEGQIELAWGESYMILLEVLLKLRGQFVKRAAALEARSNAGSLTEPEQGELSWLQATLPRTQDLAAAFKLVAIEHVARGAAAADWVIQEHPDNYVGYRVLADFYRMMTDWENFDTMVAKIEDTNPKSNGLVFLKGARAFQKDKDPQGAAAFYHQALENDPHFVRAQAHLMLIQNDIQGLYRELVALEKLNPHHQVVYWAGESIRRAYEAVQSEPSPAAKDPSS